MLLRAIPLLSALALLLSPSSQAALVSPATSATSPPQNAGTAFLFDGSESQIGPLVSNDPLDLTDPMGLEIYAPGTLDVSPEVLQAVFPSARSAALQSASKSNKQGQEDGTLLRTRLLEVRIDGYRDSNNKLRETSHIEGLSIKLRLMDKDNTKPRLPSPRRA